MAIYHLSMKTISRGHGDSIFAAAAYRAAMKLIDHRTKEIHDYRQKKDVLFHMVYLPPSVSKNYADIQDLYNSVDQSTTRRDGVYCREIECSLPRELTFDQNLELLNSFVGWFTGQNMVVQANVHGGSGGQNPHVHLLTPVREVLSDGSFGTVNREWGRRSFLERTRIVWKDLLNHAMAKAGHAQRVSHQSLAEQGINRKPTAHVGAKVCAMARRGNLWANRLIKAKRGSIDELTKVRNDFRQHTITRLQRGWFESIPEGATGYRPGAFDSAIHSPGGIGKSDPGGLAGRRR